MNSNLICVSNLQPVQPDSDPTLDRSFMDSIHDPSKLKRIQKELYYNRFTAQQQDEVTYSSRCVNLKGARDLVWGTIHNRVVCRCEKTDCPRFWECRPDVGQEQKAAIEAEKDERKKAFENLLPELRINLKHSVPDKYLYHEPEGASEFRLLSIHHTNRLEALLQRGKPVDEAPELEEVEEPAELEETEEPQAVQENLLPEYEETPEEETPKEIPEETKADISAPATYVQNTCPEFAALTLPDETFFALCGELGRTNVSAEDVPSILKDIKQSRDFRLAHKDVLQSLVTELICLTIGAEEEAAETENTEPASVSEPEREQTPEFAPEPEPVSEPEPEPAPVEEETWDGTPREFSSFTESTQEDIIKAPVEAETIVNAGPGTGKTWTLIEKLLYLTTTRDVDPDQILVLCFSRAAVEVIRDRLKNEAKKNRTGFEWNRFEIRTFDSFATLMISELMKMREADEEGILSDVLPDSYTLDGQSYDERIQKAIETLEKHSDVLDYSHIIVDEVQDLVGVRAQLVLTLLKVCPENCGFTLFGDSCQAIYDYIADGSDDAVMTSAEFYQALFDTFPEAHYRKLTINHRQGADFDEHMASYRNAILTGTKSDRERISKELLDALPVMKNSAMKLTAAELKKLTDQGSVGLLTRTNGQALMIAEHLQQIGMPYQLMRSARDRYLDSWIAEVLQDYDGERITEDVFDDRFRQVYPDVDPTPYWNALISTQEEIADSGVPVADLLEGILTRGKDPLLYTPVRENTSGLTISTVHRAKGREYDYVILTDNIQPYSENEENEVLENRVCYVAMTRPRKGAYLLDGGQSRYVVRLQSVGRCLRQSFCKGKKPYIGSLEIVGNDIDQASLADSREQQDYIRSNISAGFAVHLEKMPVYSPDMPYAILDDDTARKIGWTNHSLYNVITKAMQKCYGTSGRINWKFYPTDFCDTIIDRQVTCIRSADVGEVKGATRFGNWYLWTGLSFTGFSQRTNDRVG